MNLFFLIKTLLTFLLYVRGYLSFVRKDSITHMHGLTYVKEGFPFAWDLSLEHSVDSCFRLALLNPVSYFFPFIDHLLRLYEQFLIQFH